jgi:hypothetical protein
VTNGWTPHDALETVKSCPAKAVGDEVVEAEPPPVAVEISSGAEGELARGRSGRNSIWHGLWKT